MIRPVPGGGLTHASTAHISPYGMAKSAWRIENGSLTLEVEIPPNTSAEVILPDGSTREAGSGQNTWTIPYQPKRPDRSGLSLDTPIGVLVDDQEVYDRLVQTITPYAPGLADHLVGFDTVPLRQAMAIIPGSEALLVELEKVLEGFK